MESPAFIDFEASSLSQHSWPIEVGLAWLEVGRVVVESRLIRPRPEWPESDWDPASEAVHKISRSELKGAESADDVVDWLIKAIGRRVLVSDAPEFDQHWMDRLLGEPGPKIHDFDMAVWQAFSDGGNVKAGRLHRVYRNRTTRPTLHRAGDDAAGLCYAWRAGVGK